MTDSERINRINKIIYDRLSSLNTVLSGGDDTKQQFNYVRYPEKCLNAFVEKYNVGKFNLAQYKGDSKGVFSEKYPKFFTKCLTFDKYIPYGDINDVNNCKIPKCEIPMSGGSEQPDTVKNWQLLQALYNTIFEQLKTKGITLESGDEQKIKSMLEEYKNIIEKKIKLTRYIDKIQEIRSEFGDDELVGTSLNINNLNKISEEYNEIYKKETDKIYIIIRLFEKLLNMN
jgi:hypothetical protein